MAVIAALIPHPTRLQRLKRAAREAHTIVSCDSWDQMFQALGHQVIHIVVLDLEAAGAPNFDPVRRFKLQAPHVALIAYVTLAADRVHNVFDAGRYGFEELVIAEVDDGPSTFAKAIEKAGARGVASMLRHVIPESPNPIARDALMVAVTRAHEGLAPGLLARIVGVAPRQMARKLAEAGYPSAHRLITWGRLIVAAALMEDTRHSAERTALTIHFPSGSAFRNTCQRYLNATPTEVRRRGGALYVFDALKREIAHPY